MSISFSTPFFSPTILTKMDFYNHLGHLIHFFLDYVPSSSTSTITYLLTKFVFSVYFPFQVGQRFGMTLRELNHLLTLATRTHKEKCTQIAGNRNCG